MEFSLQCSLTPALHPPGTHSHKTWRYASLPSPSFAACFRAGTIAPFISAVIFLFSCDCPLQIVRTLTQRSIVFLTFHPVCHLSFTQPSTSRRLMSQYMSDRTPLNHLCWHPSCRTADTLISFDTSHASIGRHPSALKQTP